MRFGLKQRVDDMTPAEPAPTQLAVVEGGIDGRADVIDLTTLEPLRGHWPGPPHVVSVSKQPDLFDKELLSYRVVCSCNWDGVSFDRVDPEEDLMQTMAEAWAEHVRLSNRVFHLARKIRRQQLAGVS
jgi:hypothetical protein